MSKIFDEHSFSINFHRVQFNFYSPSIISRKLKILLQTSCNFVKTITAMCQPSAKKLPKYIYYIYLYSACNSQQMLGSLTQPWLHIPIFSLFRIALPFLPYNLRAMETIQNIRHNVASKTDKQRRLMSREDSFPIFALTVLLTMSEKNSFRQLFQRTTMLPVFIKSFTGNCTHPMMTRIWW